MRKWGIWITTFYFLIVTGLILPGVQLLMKDRPESLTEWLGIYHDWLVWLWIGILVGGEALLLFLSVDPSHKRLRPRQHVLASAALVTLMVALLAFAGVVSLLVAMIGDKLFDQPFGPYLDSRFKIIAWVLGFWLVWGVIFWRRLGSPAAEPVQIIPWLRKGSVLELLIAVPAHIVVRHRDDCSAPMATGFGIATGLAIMLLCFGPGVLLLYRDRLHRNARQSTLG